MRSLPDLSELAIAGREVSVRVTPGARTEAISVDDIGQIVIKVTAPPENGKANAAVQKLLAKSLGIAKSRVQLMRGATSRNKVFQVM